jgi:uncharacterized membrane protein
MRPILQRLRRYLVTGLIVLAPIGVTAYILVWGFRQLDPIVGRHLPPIGGVRIPGLGLLALLVILVLIGWISQRAVGRRLLALWNVGLSRVPLARPIYRASAQIFQAVLQREEKLFQRCVLIPFPSSGSWAVAFETAAAPVEVAESMGEPAVSVFLPTAPNPTTGYLIVLPSRSVRRLRMSVEDGLKLVLSAGVAVPDPLTAPAGRDVPGPAAAGSARGGEAEEAE